MGHVNRVLASECVTCKKSDTSGHNGPWELGQPLDEVGKGPIRWIWEHEVGVGLEARDFQSLAVAGEGVVFDAPFSPQWP